MIPHHEETIRDEGITNEGQCDVEHVLDDECRIAQGVKEICGAVWLATFHHERLVCPFQVYS